MSVMYCDYCDLYIDTDYNVEHFNADGECYLKQCAHGEHEWDTCVLALTGRKECVNCGEEA